ncbi:MAG: ribonuclease P protein component [Thermodesulfobacteriota bacterium]|nr:ribonuclease P protein component [Thermodesulfobacteriota bacterium]
MSDYTFKKTDRLLKRREFLQTIDAGKKIHSSCFVAGFRKNTLNRHRLGVTVTKKVGGAVTRNRIKRIVREHFRQNRQKLSGFWDINIIAKKKAADVSSGVLNTSLDETFDKANKVLSSNTSL